MNLSFPDRLACCAMLTIALVSSVQAVAQAASQDWQHQVRTQAENHQLDAALATTEQWLAAHPEDLEAHAWHGRVFSWQGRWAEAEAEYRYVLARAPNDIEILAALSDVTRWQGRRNEALAVLDQASHASPPQPEILARRAQLLWELGRTAEARIQLRQILTVNPQNAEAKRSLAALADPPRHELRLGTDIDTFNYTDAALAQSVSITSRWNSRWTTFLGTSFYQRFGENPGKFTATTAFRFTPHDWLNVGGAMAPDNAVISRREALVEYGHGFRFERSWVRGLETSYQQRWLWYRGAHVLTLGFTQIYYLPKEWTWALTVTGARSGFAGTGIDWQPSGSSRLSFPLHRPLSGNVSFAVGSENFAQVDQIGRFSARTFAGGLRLRLNDRQDINGYIAAQNRTQGRTQNSFGLSYGLRF